LNSLFTGRRLSLAFPVVSSSARKERGTKERKHFPLELPYKMRLGASAIFGSVVNKISSRGEGGVQDDE